MNDLSFLDNAKRYYGQTLAGTADLKTSACCTSDSLPPHLREILAQIEPEVLERFYGCGSPMPDGLEGCTVLDLGCGTGRDVFLASKLAGPEGRVIGLDMTPEQLEVAHRCLAPQMRRFGFDRPNVEFRQGHIEDLAAAGIEDASVDVVLSNCVINLSADKPAVFREVRRVLKPGGELCFADVFSDRRVPAALQQDPVFHGECLGGALYREDFRRLMEAVGFRDYRLGSSRLLDLENADMAAKAGLLRFYSETVRAFKLDDLEDRCEDYGQAAVYLGTLPYAPHAFVLDDHHLFPAGKAVAVCGNTASMLAKTRFAPHFRVIGERTVHYGLFDCAPAGDADGAGEPGAAGGCC